MCAREHENPTPHQLLCGGTAWHLNPSGRWQLAWDRRQRLVAAAVRCKGLLRTPFRCLRRRDAEKCLSLEILRRCSAPGRPMCCTPPDRKRDPSPREEGGLFCLFVALTPCNDNSFSVNFRLEICKGNDVALRISRLLCTS